MKVPIARRAGAALVLVSVSMIAAGCKGWFSPDPEAVQSYYCWQGPYNCPWMYYQGSGPR